jgi:hypothetical protein
MLLLSGVMSFDTVVEYQAADDQAYPMPQLLYVVEEGYGIGESS